MKQIKYFFRSVIVIFVTLLGLISKSVVRHQFASISLILLMILFSVTSQFHKLSTEIVNTRVEKYMMNQRINRLMEDSILLHTQHVDTVFVREVEYICPQEI